MCGRYAIYGPNSRYRECFGTDNEFDLAPRFNVAPSQVLPVVSQSPDGHRHFVMAKWGLIPAWVTDPSTLNHPINAKAETVAIKPMFRSAFKKSRILVPADGFYEWKTANGGKQPYFVRMRDGSPFGMAGLLEHWHGPEGEVATFTVLTTEPNPLMAALHNRMPAIVRPEDYAAWLDPGVADVQLLQAVVGPYPERLMEAYPVSKRVNKPETEGPELIARLDKERDL